MKLKPWVDDTGPVWAALWASVLSVVVLTACWIVGVTELARRGPR